MKHRQGLINVCLVIVALGVGGGLGYWGTRVHDDQILTRHKTLYSNAERSQETAKKQAAAAKQQTASPTTRYVTKVLAKHHFVGSALVVKNDHIVYRRAFGYADQSRLEKNTVNSQYQILSIQKSLTATLFMTLVDAHKVSLNTRLSRFYPTIKGAKQIRMRNLLDMTSGLTLNGVGSPKKLSEKQVVRYDVKQLRSTPKNRGKWAYQPVNFVLLSGIMMRLTHTSYATLFNHTLTKPLQLKHTGFVQNWNRSPFKTTGYRYHSTKQIAPDYNKVYQETGASMANELGTGQVYMTAWDLFKVEHKILRGDVIPVRAVRELHQSGSASTYGGGVYNQANGIRPHGVGYGFESSALLTRNGKSGVILLTNDRRPAASIQPAATKLFDDLTKGKL